MASIFGMPMQPYPIDGVHTETSESQSETEQTLHRILSTTASPPTLLKSQHTTFLARNLFSLPSAYVALDASRPWLLFWALHSFDLLGVALDTETKVRAARTVLSSQASGGGFGGGPGQRAHLLPTYASVAALAILGNVDVGEEGRAMKAWDAIDREGLYAFFMECKQENGSFVVCRGGEVDVRGIYCLLVVATLLDLLTPELVSGTDTFIAGCQTYEGGFAASAFPMPGGGVPPLAEAHGGYTSCALFSHFLLRPMASTPSEDSDAAPGVDVASCLRWAALQQGSALEAGGYRGRTNKLVDGCYGWWVGGLFAVLEALVGGGEEEVEEVKEESSKVDQESEVWEDVQHDMLFNRVALQEYVLIAAQSEKGGLRDKPGKHSDLYHTCNNLSGLSSAQHHVRHSRSLVEQNLARWRATPGDDRSDQPDQERRKRVWAEALGWVEDESAFHAVGGEENRVNTTCPVFNILLMRLKPFINHFYGQSD